MMQTGNFEGNRKSLGLIDRFSRELVAPGLPDETMNVRGTIDFLFP
jgi:hypothetical protein